MTTMTGPRKTPRKGRTPCEACGGRMEEQVEIYDRYEICLNCGRDRAAARRAVEARREQQKMEGNQNGHATATAEDIPVVVLGQTTLSNRLAHDRITEMRWPDGVRCPDCQSPDVVEREQSHGHWDCHNCDLFFACNTHSVLERSPANYRAWTTALEATRERGRAITAEGLAQQCRVDLPTAQEMHRALVQAMKQAGIEHDDMLTVSETADMINARTQRETEASERAVAARAEKRRERQARAATIPAEPTGNEPGGEETPANTGAPEEGTPETPAPQEVVTRDAPSNHTEQPGGQNQADPTPTGHVQEGETTMSGATAELNEVEQAIDQKDAPESNADDSQDGEVEPEDRAGTEALEAMRWPNGRYCPRCGSAELKSAPPSTKQPYRCSKCNLVFSVKSRSLMTRSLTPDAAWAKSIEIMMTSEERITGTKLDGEIGCGVAVCRDMINRIKNGAKMVEQHDGTAVTMTTERLLNIGDPKTGELNPPREQPAGEKPEKPEPDSRATPDTETPDHKRQEPAENHQPATAETAQPAPEASPNAQQEPPPEQGPGTDEMRDLIARMDSLERRLDEQAHHLRAEALLREILHAIREDRGQEKRTATEDCPKCGSYEATPMGDNIWECQLCRCRWTSEGAG